MTELPDHIREGALAFASEAFSDNESGSFTITAEGWTVAGTQTCSPGDSRGREASCVVTLDAFRSSNAAPIKFERRHAARFGIIP